MTMVRHRDDLAMTSHDATSHGIHDNGFIVLEDLGGNCFPLNASRWEDLNLPY